jgi:hypothetical protein
MPMKKISLLLLLVLLAVASGAIVFSGLSTLRPNVLHTEDSVALAYHMSTWGGLLTAGCLGLGLVLLFFLWRDARWWLRLPASVVVLVLVGFIFLVRLNPSTMIFTSHPEATSFLAAADADFPEPSGMVLGVRLEGEAKAFPVLLLTYHHVVNAVVGDVPVAVTY